MVLPRTCDKDTPYNPADRAYPVIRCRCGISLAGEDWKGPESLIARWNSLPACSLARSRIAELEGALAKISAIEDRMFGLDWDEIEEARTIARAALKEKSEP
jgi:hypothetical protein